jgi:hypothetical protein
LASQAAEPISIAWVKTVCKNNFKDVCIRNYSIGGSSHQGALAITEGTPFVPALKMRMLEIILLVSQAPTGH